MTSMEEFNFIAAQLEWLEEHLRAPGGAAVDSRMESALNSLACARAVIAELAQIGSGAETQAVAKAA